MSKYDGDKKKRACGNVKIRMKDYCYSIRRFHSVCNNATMIVLWRDENVKWSRKCILKYVGDMQIELWR